MNKEQTKALKVLTKSVDIMLTDCRTMRAAGIVTPSLMLNLEIGLGSTMANLNELQELCYVELHPVGVSK